MNRYAMVECPKCDGECGEIRESYAGYDDFDGPAVREDWEPCEACEGGGKVQRVDRLAWLIGEARRSEPRPAPLTMPLVVRTEVMG